MSINSKTVTFNFPADGKSVVQAITVPACVCSVTVETWGARGGNTLDFTGGLGGYAKSIFPVTPGDKLSLLVAGKGGDSTASLHPTAGGGGGASAVWRTFEAITKANGLPSFLILHMCASYVAYDPTSHSYIRS